MNILRMLNSLRSRLDKIDQEFTNIHERFQEFDRESTSVNKKFIDIDRKFVSTDEKFVDVDREFTKFHHRMAGTTPPPDAAAASAPSQPPRQITLIDQVCERLSEIKTLMGQSANLVSYHALEISPEEAMRLVEHGVKKVYLCNGDHHNWTHDAIEHVNVNEMAESLSKDELLVIADPVFDAIYHQIGIKTQIRNAVMKKDVAITPAHDQFVVSPSVRAVSREHYHSISIPYHYAETSGLKGHYAEFGTWFGRAFITNHLMYSELLDGDFYAFDSFGGLPAPLQSEIDNSKGDFVEGRYFCNLASFKLNARLAGSDFDRLHFHMGFFEETLRGKTIDDYNIKERSISICYIDCDLFEPTVDILEFVSDALEDGALIYFDDYRMARASNRSGEYDAVYRWLKKNTNFDLVELCQYDWTNQWFIFNRREEV